MKLESAYFDKVRAAQPSHQAPARERACEVPGCGLAGEYRAPKGRDREGQYFWFCLDHVRAYNKAYNYFAGMDDEAIHAFQKDAVVGNRPTWRMGSNARDADAQPVGGRAKFGWTGRAHDPFGVFSGAAEPGRPSSADPVGGGPRRAVRNQERRALDALGLDETARPDQVKAAYKALVKRHHPDANGGDRSCEDRLRQVIQAYAYLKSAGFC
jgi:DnaJ domain